MIIQHALLLFVCIGSYLEHKQHLRLEVELLIPCRPNISLDQLWNLFFIWKYLSISRRYSFGYSETTNTSSIYINTYSQYSYPFEYFASRIHKSESRRQGVYPSRSIHASKRFRVSFSAHIFPYKACTICALQFWKAGPNSGPQIVRYIFECIYLRVSILNICCHCVKAI